MDAIPCPGKHGMQWGWQVAMELFNVSTVLFQNQQYDEAKLRLERVVKTFELLLSAQHVTLSRARINLAIVYSDTRLHARVLTREKKAHTYACTNILHSACRGTHGCTHGCTRARTQTHTHARTDANTNPAQMHTG